MTQKLCEWRRAFFIEVGILTKILDAINSFDKLLDTEYIFVLGRKNKSIELHIYFEKSHFYHLAGFQYLTDIANLHVNREKVYNNIKSGNIKPELLTSSVHYGEISERIDFLKFIEMIFESNKTVFRYNSALQVFSLIEADFLLKTDVKNRNVFTFLKKDKNGKYFCKSFFPQLDKDYSEKQAVWTVLLKKKIAKSTGTEQLLYCHPNYKIING